MFVLDRWVGIAGLLLAIVASYREWRSRKRRRPMFMAVGRPWFGVEPSGEIATPSSGFRNLIVERADGAPLVGDVHVTWCYFWNAGNLEIERRDILAPMRIEFSGEGTEILDFRVARVSRPEVVGLTCAMESNRRAIAADFAILEPNDGFCLEVVSQSESPVGARLQGSIRGATVSSTAPKPKHRLAIAISLSFATPLILFASFGLMLGFPLKDTNAALTLGMACCGFAMGLIQARSRAFWRGDPSVPAPIADVDIYG